MDIKEKKRLERQKFRNLWNKTSLEEKHNVKNNVKTFLNSIPKRQLDNKYIGIYWPINNEIDIRNLKFKYQVALPKCKSNKEMDFFVWEEAKLENDVEGIPSPLNTILLSYAELSMIFVPCLSIDKNLIRLGYGGGYFDKLRSNPLWKSIPCIGILTSKCLSNTPLTNGEWDIPLSGFITDKEIAV